MEFNAIITGDIVNSRSKDIKEWLPILESTLGFYSDRFDVFRGDSFQVIVPLSRCIESLFYIKSRIKALGQIDVRMGLGIGTVDYWDEHIKNSSGQAFIFSGEAFEGLNKDLIATKSPWDEWDDVSAVTLGLCMEIANRWTVNMAETVAEVIQSPADNQQELAKKLKRKHQSQVSTELSKASWNKINKAIQYLTEQIRIRC